MEKAIRLNGNDPIVKALKEKQEAKRKERGDLLKKFEGRERVNTVKTGKDNTSSIKMAEEIENLSGEMVDIDGQIIKHVNKN